MSRNGSHHDQSSAPSPKRARTESGLLKAVIMIGGPSKGTRFRPLSMDIPKALFPIAGQPLVANHLRACAKVQGLKEVILLGFYDSKR
jgi:mannose-1-phosphate guanylyltransferase